MLSFGTGLKPGANETTFEASPVMSKTHIIEAVRKLDLESVKELLQDNPSLPLSTMCRRSSIHHC
jgi:hypothetical protein